MRTAIEDRVQDPKRRVVPVLLPGAPDNKDLKLPRFLRRATWVDYRSGLDDKEAFYRLYCGITGQAPGDRGSSNPDTSTPDTVTRNNWHLAHPYPMPPNFTGRATELKMLDDWLANDKDRLFILRALGGFGKSALSWQWINTHVNPAEWTKLVWWSFYEGDASFEHFTKETLKYLNLEIPQGQRLQVDELLKAMQSQKMLLIMDGFERALHAYSSTDAAYQGDEEQKTEDNQLDCKDINAELFLKGVCSLPNIKSKVLVTTRLTPRAVKPHEEFMLGCHEEELTAMQKEDAVEFFQKQKIKGTHAEIEAACAPYGYHPLSLRLLAGRILKDFENPADISVAQKLKIDGDIIQQKHHVLEVSYNSLPEQEQKLLSTIACFRSPVEYRTLESIVENKDTLEKHLRDLVERGVLHFDEKNKKFDLHPIVRRFAYDHFTAPQRTNAHVILVVYFEAVPTPPKIEKLEDLAPVIELYHHMVRAGNLDEALKLFYDRLHNALYFQFGVYQLYTELLRALFLDGEDKPPRLKREADQGWAFNVLANSYGMSGQPRYSVPLNEGYISISEKRGDKKETAVGLGNMALQQLVIGALSTAERNLRRSIELCHEVEDKHWEAVAHQNLGKVMSYRGLWQEAEQELEKAQNGLDEHGQTSYISVVRGFRSILFLLMARTDTKSKKQYLKSAIDYANSAIEKALIFQKLAGEPNPRPRDLVRAYWLLGAAYRAVSVNSTTDELTLAEENLSKALNLCRQINMVEVEADILLDLARLRYAQGDFKDAQEKASEALVITERSGYVLQGADVNLFLASLALAGYRLEGLKVTSNKDAAIHHAKEALRLAHCDDGPPYYYKVAYEEAERLIAQLQR
jgi:tetratricopeptide (TPR) repeat protein